MEVPKISAELRENTGSAVARKMRKEGFLPGIVYGKGEASRGITLSRKDLQKIISDSGESSMVALELNGEEIQAYIQEVQRDPVTKWPIHADFRHLIAGEKVKIRIPINVHNQEALIEDEILVGQRLSELDVYCLPDDIIAGIDIDARELELHVPVTVADLDVPEGIEVLNDPEETVVLAYYNKKAEEEEEEVDAGEGEEEITEPVFDTGADDTE